MRCRYPLRATAPSLLALLPSLVIAVGNIDCSRIVVDKTTFDFSELSGPHAVIKSIHQPPSWKNTTYTIDICAALHRPKSVADSEGFCPGGTRVCAVEHTISGETDLVSEVIPIAGELQDFRGGPLDAQFTRLRSSASHSDSEKEGVRIEMNGGIYNGRKQKAIIEFLCNKDRTGNEGNILDSNGEKLPNLVANPDGNNTTDSPSFSMGSLSYKSYEPATNGDVDILRMEWETKYACEDQIDAEKPEKASWGFFTWFIILAFMGTAAYLVFGSWLNYNRYGARGWDLLPHGDTIRDVPYLFKDWIRKVIGTVQGTGSRGGYSAV